LRKCCESQTVGLHDDPSSKDLRYGPVSILIILHPEGETDITTARGGWMVDELLGKQTGALAFYLTAGTRETNHSRSTNIGRI
jgi:hypothetical protein